MKIKKANKIFWAVALSLLLAVNILSTVPLGNSVTKVEAAVKLNKTNTTVLIGGTIQLKVKGISAKKTVTWKTSNSEVATVTNTGLVTTLKSGTVAISAKVDKKTYKCTVKVKANQFKQSAPTLKNLEKGYIHFYPMKVYYKNDELHYIARIYNRKDFRISSLANVKLAVTVPDGSDEGLLIAEKTEANLDLVALNNEENEINSKLNPGKYVTYEFVFRGDELIEKDFDLTSINKIYYTTEYVFNY